jgi:hypothetical protein
MRTRLTCCCALALVCGLSTSAALAGIVPISRNSLIKIEGQAKTDHLAQSNTLATFGTFNDGFTKTGGDPQGTHANATVSQNSTISPSASTKISGDAALATQAFAQFAPSDTAGPLMVRATSELTVIFQVVDKEEPFSVSGAFDSNDIIGATAHFQLLQTSEPAPGKGKVDISFDNAVGSIIGGGLDFAQAQSLPPGTYQLFADSVSGSSGSGRGDPLSFGENTGVHFTFSAGQTATAIPLPPALWPGLIVLAGVLGRLTYRRRTS